MSDNFDAALNRFTVKVERKSREVFLRTATDMFGSVRDGSAVTGAPGQPVDLGFLKASWQLDVEGNVAQIMTHTVYAPQIEDGTRGGRALTLRSPTGGFHSVKLSVTGFQRIVDQAAASVARGD